jgi:hypothetical protein
VGAVTYPSYPSSLPPNQHAMSISKPTPNQKKRLETRGETLTKNLHKWNIIKRIHGNGAGKRGTLMLIHNPLKNSKKKVNTLFI